MSTKWLPQAGPISELLEFWHYLVYHLPDGMERNTNAWGTAATNCLVGRRACSTWPPWSAESSTRWPNFAATGVSDEVRDVTLGYIGQYTRDIKKKRGVWGLEICGLAQQLRPRGDLPPRQADLQAGQVCGCSSPHSGTRYRRRPDRCARREASSAPMASPMVQTASTTPTPGPPSLR